MSVVFGLLLGAGVLLCASPLLWPDPAPAVAVLERPVRWMRNALVQAGLDRVNPGVLLVVAAGCASSCGAIGWAALGVAALGVIAGMAGFALPFALIAWRARQRRRATRVVWPDVVDHLVSGLRSGLSLAEALGALGDVGPQATRAAFRAFRHDVEVTGDLGRALDSLKQRLADPVADRIVESLRMAREVGGTEITGVLRTLSSFLRQDAALRSEVDARQSWIRNAARLGVAAPWIVLLLLATRPEAARAYDSPAGGVLLGVGFVVSLVAYRLMITLGRLPDERRWFA